MDSVPLNGIAQRTFIPRKAHTKSRGGCFYCKKRRVKCTETRPSCKLCSEKGQKCDYSLLEQSQSRQMCRKASLNQPSPPQLLPTSFAMADLRLFHHFMLKAHPHHPIGNKEVWVQNIPLLAHQYNFLMNAILALAASNLTACSTSDFNNAALAHRVRAVRSLDGFLSQPPGSVNDADAILATFYTLGFQSLYMDDGLIDFLIMVRGCLMMTGQIQSNRLNTAFYFADADAYINHMDPTTDDFSFMNPELAFGATASLGAIRPLCHEMVETLTLNLIEAVVFQMQRSAIRAYYSFMRLYETIATFTYQEFLYFTDSKNEVMQIVLGHFVALHIIAAPIIMMEELKFKKSLSIQKSRDWLRGIIENVQPAYQQYLQWPKALMEGSKTPMLPGSVLQLLGNISGLESSAPRDHI